MPCGCDAGAAAIGAIRMRWTAEAVEDLKRLALEGRSASVIAAAVGAASRNAVIGKANRIGIKLNGWGAAGLRKAQARADRAQWAMPHAQSDGVRPRAARALGVVPGSGRGDREAREAAGEIRGHSRIRLPMAAWRPESGGVRLLRTRGPEGPVLLRRPLPDGLPGAGGAGEAEPA